MRMLLLLVALIFASHESHAEEESTRGIRDIIAEAMVEEDLEKQQELLVLLKETPQPEIIGLLDQWKMGEVYLFTPENGPAVPVIPNETPDSQGLVGLTRFSDNEPLTDESGTQVKVKLRDLEYAETSSRLRRSMKDLTDYLALADPDSAKRLRAVQNSAVGQDLTKLPALSELLNREADPKVRRALDETIAIIQLKSPDSSERIAAVNRLGELTSLASQDAIRTLQREASEADDYPTVRATEKALAAIDTHISTINAIGTAFRGISLGSVLLVVAIGLAITFGLMGVINMAHGELIAVGAYTTYIIQNIFDAGLRLSPFGKSLAIPGMNLGESGTVLYFIVALPASFLAAALVGVLLERSVIRFLYRRPLESLLATWGVSLVLQQLFRLIFGSNNVQVSSPPWLSGNWTVNDVVFGWNRVFVIGFAVIIIVVTWLVLNKTSLGLLIRAVMQNRNMAACMGVRTERVNTMTFAFGSGLAGLAGAFLSQIGNVGPSLGQNYIVDSFMTVVVGGVGNILGTVISALGIGLADQTLQQYLGNPVLGKILVLGFIIIFLQWRPAGLFATRSRTLD